MANDIRTIKSPQGEEFAVSDEATNRILNEGIPFIIIDMKERRLAIKENNLFLYTNLEGNIYSGNTSGLGFYLEDTRFLSLYEMKLNGRDPILLSSSAENNYMIHVELTNTDIWEGDKLIVPQESLNIRRQIVLKDRLYERLRIKNYSNETIKLGVELYVYSDFSDIFEIRGQRRLHRGQIMQPKFSDNSLKLAYLGQDKNFRQTRIDFDQSPSAIKTTIEKTNILYEIEIDPYERFVINLVTTPSVGTEKKSKKDFTAAISSVRKDYSLWKDTCVQIQTNNELFNKTIERGNTDIKALISKSRDGAILDAGIPWFTSPFGRDSLVSSFMTLILNPDIAKKTILFLSKFQGKKYDNWRDEEPGKIFHEIRRGELAILGEIPHNPYYGSIDSTPLYLILVWEYLKWTNDMVLLQKILPNIEAAVEWLNKYADIDGDLFVEYKRRSRRGLTNQGWKDSTNAVMHTNGVIAQPPIALAEVQGYVYHAKKSMSELFKLLNKNDISQKLSKEADELKKRFNEVFWMPDEEYFAMALDGDKKQVKNITSNPGQCLWSGIVDDDKAIKVKNRLLAADMFSGWGIRTLSKAALNYNPMSYHNGSVWPHDTALIAYGFKKYKFIEDSQKLLSSLFDVSNHQSYHRLPELFCGFTRRGDNWPVEYPVACKPQAWSAGSFFLLLKGMLGIHPNAIENKLFIKNPSLPDWLENVTLKNLMIGNTQLKEIKFIKEGTKTKVVYPKNQGTIKIVLEK